jgi:hypothetical protein
MVSVVRASTNKAKGHAAGDIAMTQPTPCETCGELRKQIAALSKIDERGMGHDDAMSSIASHVHEIQVLCDAFGYDPSQWLQDEVANDCAAPPKCETCGGTRKYVCLDEECVNDEHEGMSCPDCAAPQAEAKGVGLPDMMRLHELGARAMTEPAAREVVPSAVSGALRALLKDLRTTPVRLDVFIPAIQKAADEHDRLLAAEREAHAAEVRQLERHIDRMANRSPEPALVAMSARESAAREYALKVETERDQLQQEVAGLRSGRVLSVGDAQVIIDSASMLESISRLLPEHEIGVRCQAHLLRNVHLALSPSKGDGNG